MKLNYKGIQNREEWERAGVRLPDFDWKSMAERTMERPVWVHFGGGNIFRGYIAGIQQKLLNLGSEDRGIFAAETFDDDIIDKIYRPHDNMTLMVSMKPDGTTEKEVIASIAGGIKADSREEEGFEKLKEIFSQPSLQLVSFTITEKGYALKGLNGEFLPEVERDFSAGPKQCTHAMSIVAALLFCRFNSGKYPLALVSMDNCSRNGEKLKSGVITVARQWKERGFVTAEFMDWLQDETKTAFLWTMIDKITPRPSNDVGKDLEEAGIEEMTPLVTARNTYIAPFVNAEVPEYLVIEDRFPNDRPAFEKAGVYMADRETVTKTEQMKVHTCLNPLHTALAIFGCLLGYSSIAEEMQDEDLKKLTERIGYVEGLPVVTDPGILKPVDFLKEVVEMRLTNPFIPDTPQRIATDTSQKVAVRYGETIKCYLADEALDVKRLTCIPLVIAGWLRYLLAVDDKGNKMELSKDPMLTALQKELQGIEVESIESGTVGTEGQDLIKKALSGILSNRGLFGVDLKEAGLAERIEEMFSEMSEGPGAVRKTLHRYVWEQRM